jgi:hypothetical protein
MLVFTTRESGRYNLRSESNGDWPQKYSIFAGCCCVVSVSIKHALWFGTVLQRNQCMYVFLLSEKKDAQKSGFCDVKLEIL